MRFGRQGGDHSPVGDVADRVKDVEQDEDDDENDDENGFVDVYEAEQPGEDREHEDRRDDAADHLPRAEAAEARVGVVDEVSEQGIEEDLRDADDENKGCDYADQRFRFGLAVVREQGLGGVVRDEIGAERVVERRLPKVAHSV